MVISIQSQAARGRVVAAALVLAACGQAASEPGIPPSDGALAAPSGGPSRDPLADPDAPSTALTADAPACAARRYSSQLAIAVPEASGVAPASPIWTASFDPRVTARGHGLPKEPLTLPAGYTAPADAGWLRLEAAASDAGTDRAPSTEHAPERVPYWLIIGPSDLAGVPLVADAELHVEVDRELAPSSRPVDWKLKLSWEYGVLVLVLDTRQRMEAAAIDNDGIVLQRGAPLCQTSDECFYYYEHSLDVTVRDGTS